MNTHVGLTNVEGSQMARDRNPDQQSHLICEWIDTTQKALTLTTSAQAM